MESNSGIINLFSLAPALWVSLAVILFGLFFSSYVKVVTVIGMIRVGLGLDSVFSIGIGVAAALALTVFIMHPVLEGSLAQLGSIEQFRQSSDIEKSQGIVRALGPWKSFMERHSSEETRARFGEIAAAIDGPNAQSKTADPLSFRILAPSFLVSELRSAFTIGLTILLPFLVVDLLTGTVLTALGLGRFDPHVIALPLKLLMFTAVDGWSLLLTNLASSYIGG